MARGLSVNSKLKLQSNGSFTEFTVDEIKGAGGSCVAYEVSFYEDGHILHKGILKEFCPAYLGNINRDNCEIIVPEEHAAEFQKGLLDFKVAYRGINEYIAKNKSASNYHPVQLGLYEGNNTLYTLSSCDYGKPYDKLTDDSLYSLIKIILATAKGVEQYHSAGFVHCDIKPANIFILDDVTDIIKLFDYDSLLKIDDIKSGAVTRFPNPSVYYVPELNDLNIRNIGVQTDIFEIGAMLYLRLFGKAPDIENMSYDSEYNFDDSPLMSGASPKAVFEIEKLFRNTLQISKRRRYKTVSQLINQLELILSLVDNKQPFLMNLPAWQPSSLCVERKYELNEVYSRLQNDGYVFVKGMGGLGKSELAKLFVKQYGEQFHTVQFCKYVDSLKSLTASMPISGINDGDYKNIDELAKAKNKILHQSDSNTLIIVDNFNVTYDKYLREFLPSDNKGFKVIFTTRCMPAADYYEDKVLELQPLSLTGCTQLFYMHSGLERSLPCDPLVEELINEIQFNTLLLILIAKTVKRTKMPVSEILAKLREQELDSVSARVFYEYDYSDDEIEVYNKINSHLNTVFNISGLTSEEQQALLNMTLISAYGISEDEFVNACACDAVTAGVVESLVNKGWLDFRDNIISMHSIVSDVISEKGIEKQESYYSLAEYIEDKCRVDEDNHISEIQRALADAKQLERRYKYEDEMSVAFVSFQLGNIYMALYRPKEAKPYLDKALAIKQAECDYEELPFIYNVLGDYEGKFGTKTQAIIWYEKALEAAENTEGEFFDEISKALLGLAECYDDNNEKDKALDEYIKLINYRIENKLDDYNGDIIEDIIALCEELDRQEDLLYYQSLLKEFKKDGAEENNGFLEKFNSDDYEQVQRDYEQFLSEIREELGEESPYYKDIAKYRWVYFLINGDKEQGLRLIAENMEFIESTYGESSMEMAEFLSLAAYQLADKCEFDTALEMAQRALEICKLNNQQESYTALQANVASIMVYATTGDPYSAYEIVKKLNFNKFSGNDYLKDLIKSVGLVFINLSMYDEAKELAQKALNTKKLDRMSHILASEIMIICCEQEGDINNAQQYLQDISDEIDSLSTLKFANDYILIYKRMEAKIYYGNKDYIKAIESLNSAIELYEDKKDITLSACYQERGIYYYNLNEFEKAREDYARCEKINEIYNLSDKRSFLLYNNIAIVHFVKQEYAQAKEYYEKIFEIMPEVRDPDNYTEALICQNYGWIEYNLGNPETGEEYIKRALKFYEQKKITTSRDCLIAKYNLSVIYTSRDDYEKALPLLLDLYNSFDKLQDNYYSVRINIVTGIMIGLCLSDRAQTAYDFANDEDKHFAKTYGKISTERIDYLQRTAGAFKLCGYEQAFDFLVKSRKLIKKAGLENSVWQASQDNYAGVIYLDIEQNAEIAKEYFERAKAMLENLSRQDCTLYSQVESNLKYTKDKLIEEIIKDMAESLLDEEGGSKK